MANLLEHFKCPICFEVPEGKAYQCKNGHTFCNKCNLQLSTCPQCRTVLEKERIRNRTLEQLLDVIDFSCPNKSLGCVEVLKRQNISTHLKFCKFEPFYFCKLIGFQSCTYNAIESLENNDSEKLHAHLRDSHPEIQGSEFEKDNSTVTLQYQNIISMANRSNSAENGKSITIWTPQLVKYSEGKKKEAVLLFLCQISEVTRNAAWICLSLTECFPDIVEFKISNNGGKGNGRKSPSELVDKTDLLSPEIAWKAPVLPFKYIEKELDRFAFRMSFCVLNTFKSENGTDLKLTLSIPLQKNPCKTTPDLEQISRTKLVTQLVSFLSKPNLSCQQHLDERHSHGLCCSYLPLNSRGCGSEDNHTDNEDNDEDEQIVFSNIFCNECGERPITKIRYKCLQCIDYDLCKNCMESKGVHGHHVFSRIQNARQNDFFNWKHRIRALRGKSSYI